MAARKSSLASRYNSVGSDGDFGISELHSESSSLSSIALKTAALKKLIIIGDDDRVPVVEMTVPYSSICLLRITAADGELYHGTGFMISKRCVITSGHCVHFNNQWVKTIAVIPGANGNSEPHGRAMSIKFRSVKGWTREKDPNFDYGAVILPDDTLYNSVQGVFDYKPYADEQDLELVGYPSDKNQTQWKSAGKIKSKSKFRLYYELDTMQGNSGSPVYIRTGNALAAVGVHSYGDNPNYSIRINDQMVDRWKEWSVL